MFVVAIMGSASYFAGRVHHDRSHVPGQPSHTYMNELASVNSRVQSLSTFISNNAHSWPHFEQLALAYLDRARLSGEFTDYQKADNAIQQAFDISGTHAGPYLTRAYIHLALHRTDSALNDLNQVKNMLLVQRETALAVEGLVGDALIQLGETEAALEKFELTEKQNPSFKTAARLSQALALNGNYPLAGHWLSIGEKRVSSQSAYLSAWLELQHGILALEQDLLDEAYEHFSKADQTFPGYWLIEEHLAEVDALSGRTALAEDRYRAIVDRAPIPQMKLALADVLDSRDSAGNRNEVELLRRQADQQFTIIRAVYPALTSAH